MARENGMSLSFHNIRYEIKEKKFICGKATKKEILKGLSGLLPPGLNAIMGPTGSGKTSLLDVLAQRKDPHGLKEGLVLLNGEKPPADFRLMSGYVVQDDVVMGTLTVRENLSFSANLRLSNKVYDSSSRKNKVEQVIEQLGLQACADTMVGNEFVRGVSGGERKRVNIGMEMILDPPVLFLDEPTTGLDSNTANAIVLLLYKLAMDGRNIIISIHQPRYSIFSLFCGLIILNKGSIVYRGPAKSSVKYFSEIGYDCPTFHNPADFFLDVVGGGVSTARLIGRMHSRDLAEASNVTGTEDNGGTAPARHEIADSNEIVVAMEEDETADNHQYLIDMYSKSTMALDENKKLLAIMEKFESMNSTSLAKADHYITRASYANGFFSQLSSVMQRQFLNLIRHPMILISQVMIMIIFGLLIGLIYFKIDTSFTSGIQNRAGCFFFLASTEVMSNLSALQLFIQNREHFIHESASGYYRVSVYFIAQVFADLIPNRLIPNTFFCCIIYFMIGFELEVAKFFIFFLTVVITALSASSTAFFVSASVRVFAIANIAVSLPYILMMLFGGFLVNTGSLLDWLEWIKYISIFRYCIDALTVNEMTGLVFIDNSSYPGYDRSSPTPCISVIDHSLIPNCTTGEIYMETQGIAYGVKALWVNIIALGAIALGFIFLAYVQLRRVNKFK